MAQSQNGPRSNFSLLPFDVQYKIVGMLQDGATFAAIAADQEIAEAYRQRGLTLTAPAISRVKRSPQYRDWTSRRLDNRQTAIADRLTTAFLRENDSLDTIAEQTKVALLKVVRECISGAEDTKELERLVRSAATLSNTAKDNRIADLTRKLDDMKRQRDATEAEWQRQKTELLAGIDRLTARVKELEAAVPGVESAAVAEAMKKKFGVS